MKTSERHPLSAQRLRFLITSIQCLLILVATSNSLQAETSSIRVQTKAKVAGETVYKVGKKIILTASFDSPNPKYLWIPLGESGINLDTETVGSSLHVWAPKGRYSILLIATDYKSEKQGQVTYSFSVTDKGTPPDPLPPNPPDPPVPPTPVDDPLVKALSLAFSQETANKTDDQKKKLTEQVRILADVYRAGSKLTASMKVTTVKQLNAVVHDTATNFLKETDLAIIRKNTLTKYMNSILPSNPNTTLTQELREKFKQEYLKIAAALDEVTKDLPEESDE